MAEYYYFAATLPMLSMDREAPITYSAFMEQANAHLTRRDYSDLEKAVMAAADGDAKLPLVRAWQAYAGRIRRLMNSYRAARLGFPGYEAREGGDRMLEERIRRIVDEMEPLEAEKAVLSLYFDFLSSEEGGSPFSSRALMIYALKLQLIGRASSFSQEKGSAEFDRLYRTIEADIFR